MDPNRLFYLNVFRAFAEQVDQEMTMTVTQSRARDVARKAASAWQYRERNEKIAYRDGDMPDAIVEELERQKMFATQDMLSLVEHAKVLAKNEYWYTNSPPTTTDLIRAIGQRILDQEGPVDRYEKRPFELSCCVDHVFGPNDAHLARVEVARFYGHEADHEAEIHARYLTNKLPKS